MFELEARLIINGGRSAMANVELTSRAQTFAPGQYSQSQKRRKVLFQRQFARFRFPSLSTPRSILTELNH